MLCNRVSLFTVYYVINILNSPVSTFQRMAVMSSAAEARRLQSGEKQRVLIISVWPSRVDIHWPVSAFQISTVFRTCRKQPGVM